MQQIFLRLKQYKNLIIVVFFSFFFNNAIASYIFIPMDEGQTDHLKAYGIAFWTLEKGSTCDWLLNYKGGSFALPYIKEFEKECLIRGVKYEVITENNGRNSRAYCEYGCDEIGKSAKNCGLFAKIEIALG